MLRGGGDSCRCRKAQAQQQAQLYQTIGTMYNRLGTYEQSEKVLSQALDRAGEAEGSHGKRVAEVLVQLAKVRGDRGELTQAQQAIDEAVAVNTAHRLDANNPVAMQTRIVTGKIACSEVSTKGEGGPRRNFPPF